MIYKIQGDFKNILGDLIIKLSKDFDIFYQKDILYVADKNDENKDIYKSLKPKKDFFVIVINENNLMNETSEIIEWCKNHFVMQETCKLERESQKELQSLNNFIDAFEEEVKKILEKKGG